MTTDPKLVEAGAQAIELCSLWTPRRLADAVLTAAIPLIRKAALEEAAKVAQRHFTGMFTGWKGYTSESLITLDEAEDAANECGPICADAILALLTAPQKQEGGGD